MGQAHKEAAEARTIAGEASVSAIVQGAITDSLDLQLLDYATNAPEPLKQGAPTLSQTTGTGIALTDPERFAAICKAVIDGERVTSITKAFHVNADTVYAVHHRLAKRGLVEPLIERNRHKMAVLQATLLDLVQERASAGVLDDRAASISLGIVSDKVAHSAGQTVTVNHNVKLSLDAVREKLAIASSRSPDLQSANSPLITNGLPVIDAPVVSPELPELPTPAQPATPVSPVKARAVKKGGEGVKKRGGRAKPDGSH